jgi:hypothetical protein
MFATQFEGAATCQQVSEEINYFKSQRLLIIS